MSTETTQTSRERAMQAVTRGMELLLDLKDAEELETVARSSRSQIELDNNVVDLQEGMAADMETVTRVAEAVYNTAAEKARELLTRAENTYEQKRQVAQDIRDKEVGERQAAWDQKIEDEKKNRELAVVAARVDVHQAREEVNAIKATIDQFRQVVQGSIGIDPGNLFA